MSAQLPDVESTKQLAHGKHTKGPEGAPVGAATGGAVGGTLGLLVGIGALAIPGLGPFFAAGPIMATLAGAGVGGAPDVEGRNTALLLVRASLQAGCSMTHATARSIQWLALHVRTLLTLSVGSSALATPSARGALLPTTSCAGLDRAY